MSEPGGWTTPEGWGGPTQGPPYSPPPAPGQSPPPPYGQPAPPYAQSAYGAGQPPWGQRPAELKPGVVPLRPLGLGELLDGAVGIIRRYPRPALGLSAIVALVTTLLNVALLVTAFQPLLDLDTATLETGDIAALEEVLGGAAAGGLLTILLALLSGAVLTGGLTAVVGKAVLGEPMSFAEAWRQLRPVLLRLVGLALLVLLIVYGILLAGIVGGAGLIAIGGPVLAIVGVPLILAPLVVCPYLYIRFSLAPCALVLERTGILTSLRRSSALVKRDWWRVFGILLLTLIVGLFVSQVVQLPFAVLGAGSPGNLFDPDADVLGTRPLVLSAIGGGLASTVVAPFTAGVRALLYVDRRMRSEGLDVALTAAVAARR
ncbi:MAG: hypothetical protein KY451_01030 [Actinobacteria bacterium]|nr:hypothetical protein [Actinomycetota bacterium]MBW3646507.1 hypothetical protein [Actinomycetota bacterium]